MAKTEDIQAIVEKFYEKVERHLSVINNKTSPNKDMFRAYYIISIVLNKLYPKGPSSGDPIYEMLGTRIGRKRKWLNDVRKFATIYSPDELNELCRSSVRCWGPVRLSLYMKPAERKKWLERVERDGLTANDIYLERRARRESKPQGGRPTGGSIAPLKHLNKLVRLGQDCLNLHRTAITGDQAASKQFEEMLAKIPPNLPERLSQAATAVQELGERCKIVLRAVKKTIPIVAKRRRRPRN